MEHMVSTGEARGLKRKPAYLARAARDLGEVIRHMHPHCLSKRHLNRVIKKDRR